MILPQNTGGDNSSRTAGIRWRMSHYRQCLQAYMAEGLEVRIRYVDSHGDTYRERVRIANWLGRNKVITSEGVVIDLSRIEELEALR